MYYDKATGQSQQRPPVKVDVDPKEPPAKSTTPEKTASPPATPPKEKIDKDYIVRIAKQNLPDNEAFRGFVTWSHEQLPTLTKRIIETSGINKDSFVKEMKSWLRGITEKMRELNEKIEPKDQSCTKPTWPPMPGVSCDSLCTSIFDANDLALRGRKSVLVKNFYFPIVFPQFLLDNNQNWAFGQKIQYDQEWRHEGFTLGELISSLSLLPNEELTLEVSSWQRTKSEITEETNTEHRERLEREQRRTDEESCINDASVSNGWSASATGSVSLGPACASMSASATGNTSERSEQAAKHITEATSKAANEISVKRAIKMTQTAEAGSESRTTRRIRNPNISHTVTYNFFQIIKLYDIQLRLVNDAPIVILPGIFPAVLEDGKEVEIPYWTIESFTSPAVFLTQFFEVDRELSEEINGFGLRVRMDAGRNPEEAIAQLAEALIIATKYLFKLDPNQYINVLANFISNYIKNTTTLRQQSLNNYGVEKGLSQQIATPGIYADSLLGRCSASEPSIEAGQYVQVMRQYEEVKQIERMNQLADTELERRKKLLEKGKLDPFDGKLKEES